MPKMKPTVAEIGKHFIKCPNCNAPAEFSCFYTNITLNIASSSVYPFHRRFCAVCPKCGSLFYIKKEKGESLLLRLDVSLTADDLSKEKES